MFLFSMADQVINQVLLDDLPIEGCFSTTTIENYILPSKQNLERGRALVACGFVRGIQLANRSSKYRLTWYVQAEKATGKWYKTKLCVEKSKDKWTTACTCKARNHSTRCKHQTAFLYAVICLRDHSEAVVKCINTHIYTILHEKWYRP